MKIPRKLQNKRLWPLYALLLIVILVTIDYFAYPYGAAPAPMTTKHAENGLWLRYPWYFGTHSDSEIDQLAKRLEDNQIVYAYAHVRNTRRTGALVYHYPTQAKHLVTRLHQKAPDVKVVAWIYAGNKHGMGLVDLSNPTVRKTMVSEAVWLVTKCGFDGVQWDYEICDNDDKDFLRLLRETRAALPHDKILSVATPIWLPDAFSKWGWRDAYFEKIAATCDQMTVMMYDSACYLPRQFVWLTQQQVIHVTQDAARGNPKCRVLIGIPTYEAGGPSHQAHTENIRFALYGVRAGLADSRTVQSSFAGVAPFADYTTDASEWETYQKLWLGK